MELFAFVFPGQGSQVVGMGADLAREFPAAREVFETADRALGQPISRLCWDGPADVLRHTAITQPAVVATSLAAWRVLHGRGLMPALAAGHSVGEYAALAAAGVITIDDCLRLVARRGQLMQEAGEQRPGTMAAIFGLSLEQVESVCRQIETLGCGVLEVANLNSPEQIVVSGDALAVEKAETIAREAGARRFIPLAVSGAFHSSLMAGVADHLAVDLDAVEFRQADFPVVANVTAQPLVHPTEVRDALRRQVSSRVRWVEGIRAMLARGVSTFVEIGPGTALAGMIRKIQRDVRVLNVQDAAGLLRTIDALSTNVAG